MTNFSKTEEFQYLFLLNVALCTIALFFLRRERAFLLKKRVFSSVDSIIIALDVICSAQPPVSKIFLTDTYPEPESSGVIALSTSIPLFLWVRRRENGKSSTFLVVCMLFHRVTLLVLFWKSYPLHMFCVIFGLRYLWKALNFKEPNHTLPRIV